MNILALIPARSGSKTVPDKNIKSVGGKPLIAFSIEHAVKSKYINKVIVSTDNDYYADIARSFGAETPFLRPAELAGDFSTDLEVFQHAIQWLQVNEKYIPDICVHLRPTYPIRDIEDIDSMLEILLKNEYLDSIRSVSPSPETPFKMWFRDDTGKLQPVIQCDIPDFYNLPRQQLPKTYLQNACIDIIRTSTIVEKNSMTGTEIFGYIMKENYDIDTFDQLDRVITELTKKSIDRLGKNLTFCFDIDGVIAQLTPDNDYAKAVPIIENIKVINELHNRGHEIILNTARGFITGKEWRTVTEQHLKEWGCLYHKLYFGKPASDYYIDDKLISIETIKNLLKNEVEK